MFIVQCTTVLKFITMQRNNNNNNNRPQNARRNGNAQRPRQVRQAEPAVAPQNDQPPPQDNFYRNRRPNNNQAQNIAPRGIPASRPTERIQRGDPTPFTPKSLSTQSSKEKNDPMLKESILVEGLSGMIPVRKTREFHLDYSQYITLVRETYIVMTKADRGLAKFVSLSLFEYYCVILLWKRLSYVETSRGDGVLEYERLKRALPPNLAIPEEIGIYLDGIGNVIDAEENTFELRIYRDLARDLVNGLSGHYGRVDAATHEAYETAPAPFVSYYRMVMDLARDQGMPERWNLPPALQPPGNFSPNENLLSWLPAANITAEQRIVFENTGFDVNYTPAEGEDPAILLFELRDLENINGLPINRNLLTHVSGLLSSSKSPFNGYKENESFSGSICQMLFFDRSKDDRGIDRRDRTTPIQRRDMIGYSAYSSSQHVTCAGVIFRYRVVRRSGTVRDDLCYSHNGVAPDWQTGDVYTSVPDWNRKNFLTVQTNGQNTAISFSQKVRKVAANN